MDDKTFAVILILANVVETCPVMNYVHNTFGEEQLGVKLLGDYSTEKQERAWNSLSHE